MSATRLDDSQQGIGALIGSLAKDVLDLVWGEVRLARAELDQKLRRIILAVIMLIGSAVLALAGLLIILPGIALVLAIVLPTWAAFLIVGAVFIIIAALLARSGVAMLSLKALSPNRTIASLQKDSRLIKEHM